MTTEEVVPTEAIEIPKEVEIVKEVKEKKKKNYLNNADMMKQIQLSKEKGKMTDEFARMMMMLAKRYAQVNRFSNYSYNDDLQAFAMMTVCKVWRGFDADKYQNPFAYFTQIVHNAFFQFNNQERKERNIRDQLLVSQGRTPSFGFSEGSSDDMDSFGDNDYMEINDDPSKDITLDDYQHGEVETTDYTKQDEKTE